MFGLGLHCRMSVTSWVNVRVRVRVGLRVSGYPGGVLCIQIQYRSTGHGTHFVNIYHCQKGV